jgi:arsenate reductase (thioredoxin)
LQVLAVSNVLFVCIGNQGRSVLAERLFRAAAGDRHAARSAGSAPGVHAHPEVLQVLAELGIDAADHVPHKLDQADVEWADVVVATCDDACPYVPGKRYVNWQLPDPIFRPLDEVRTIRDDIAERVAVLLEVLAAEPARDDREDRDRDGDPVDHER